MSSRAVEGTINPRAGGAAAYHELRTVYCLLHARQLSNLAVVEGPEDGAADNGDLLLHDLSFRFIGLWPHRSASCRTSGTLYIEPSAVVRPRLG